MLATHSQLPDPNDTIVAISSAPGPGARAIVRMSGTRAAVIANSLCPDLPTLPQGLIPNASLRVAGFHSRMPADIYLFKAPRTYTGQDIVEIHMPACMPIVNAVVAQCLDAGARAAQPGEFTLRAFLAGKVDLTRAEAILGVIESRTRHDLQIALKQLAGGITQPLQRVREDVLNMLADVEAGLDFADENIQFVAADDLLRRIGNALALLQNLSRQLDQRTRTQRPFRVVLAGKPNAGKSSLFNAIVGADDALVSAEAGTTRDYLEKVITIENVQIEMVDTAGLGAARCDIGKEAQRATDSQTTEADCVLWCVSCGDADMDIPTVRGTHDMAIATKADLGPTPASMLATSAHSGVGIVSLKQHLAQVVKRASIQPLASSVGRCHHHVRSAMDHLRNAHALVLEQETPEFLALELRLVLEDLGAMTGAIHTTDLLDRIFSRFCIGK